MVRASIRYVACSISLALLAGCASHHEVKPRPAVAGQAWQVVIGGMSEVAVRPMVTAYMDAQAAELKAVTEAQIQRVEDGIVVTLNDRLLFDFGGADLSPRSRETLGKLAAIFTKYPTTRLTVTGNTDNVGSISSNIRLSERRAKVVADTLLAMGVPPERIRIMGLGFARPVASNDSAAGRARNRRVEIHVAPTQGLHGPDAPFPVAKSSRK